MTITKELSRCIKDSIRRKEDERRTQKIKDEKEIQQLIKEIKEFFKELPRRQGFEFSNIPFYKNDSPSRTVDSKIITIYKKFFTGEIVIYTNISVFLIWMFGSDRKDFCSIEFWNLQSIRAMHANLPWFEEQLRTRYGCSKE